MGGVGGVGVWAAVVTGVAAAARAVEGCVGRGAHLAVVLEELVELVGTEQRRRAAEARLHVTCPEARKA
eukprot:4228579-Prymnesium_polylepis.1